MRAVADVGAKHKAADLLFLLFEDVVEMRTQAGGSKRTVVDAEPIMPSGIRPCYAFIGTGAHFRSTGILIAVGSVGNGADETTSFEGIKLLLKGRTRKDLIWVVWWSINEYNTDIEAKRKYLRSAP